MPSDRQPARAVPSDRQPARAVPSDRQPARAVPSDRQQALDEALGDALHPRGQCLATRADLVAAGLTRAGLDAAVASGKLIRVRPGVYAPAALPARGRHLVSGGRPDAGYLTAVRAVLLNLGPGAAAGGRTAAVLWGLDLAVEPREVEVAVPRGRSRISLAGVLVRQHRDLQAEEHAVLELQPLRVLTPLATVVDVALHRPRREAVVLADSALRSGAVTLDELVGAAHGHRLKPGARRLRAVLELVDPQSGSVLESLLRVLLADHGLHPSSQVELRGAPGLIGRVDFAFLQHGVVVECDGRRWHDPDDARRKDRWRDNELGRVGWRVLRVTWDEVTRSPAYVVALVRDALAAAPVSRAS